MSIISLIFSLMMINVIYIIKPLYKDANNLSHRIIDFLVSVYHHTPGTAYNVIRIKIAIKQKYKMMKVDKKTTSTVICKPKKWLLLKGLKNQDHKTDLLSLTAMHRNLLSTILAQIRVI